MNLKTKLLYPALSIAALAALTACGGGGGGSSGATGTLDLKITDAPVDAAKAVVVEFTGVALKRADGEEIVITFDAPRTIDLLALQGGASASLLEDRELPAGRYEWMRLMVNAQRGVIDSYITLDDNSQHSLFVPSGAQTGLKLVSGFTVPANAAASFTIDFDLRKSITQPQSGAGDYFLKPALRVVDNAQVGGIAGTVGTSALQHASCPNKDPALNSNVVYVFEGAGVAPDDIDGAGVEPVATANATANGTGAYSWRTAFLTPGAYTVAFTCQGATDDPESSQAIIFIGTQDVTVVKDQVAPANF